MTIGAIGFLQPWILSALIALPIIWWLLRFTPPRPVEIAFPPIRLLLGLRSQEETPQRSPSSIRSVAAPAPATSC